MTQRGPRCRFFIFGLFEKRGADSMPQLTDGGEPRECRKAARLALKAKKVYRKMASTNKDANERGTNVYTFGSFGKKCAPTILVAKLRTLLFPSWLLNNGELRGYIG
jgi:hypothetical protein